jgi:hypothetical protein
LKLWQKPQKQKRLLRLQSDIELEGSRKEGKKIGEAMV